MLWFCASAPVISGTMYCERDWWTVVSKHSVKFCVHSTDCSILLLTVESHRMKAKLIITLLVNNAFASLTILWTLQLFSVLNIHTVQVELTCVFLGVCCPVTVSFPAVNNECE